MENTRAKLKIRGLPFVRHEEFAGPQPSVMQSSVGEVGGTSAPENGGSNGSSHGQMFLSFLSRKLGRRSRLVSRNPGIVSGNGGEVVIAGVADARPTQNTEMVGDGGNGYTSHPGPAPASIARLQEVNVSLEPVGSRAQGDTLGLGVNSGISSRGPRERLALMYVQRVGVMNGAEGDACWHGGEANIPSALEALPGILEVAHSTSQALGKPGVAQIFSSGVNIANTGLDGIDTLSETYLQPLKLFSGVVNTISGLHPYAKMALVALSWPAQVIISQANRDVAIVVLVAKICDIYAFIMEDKNLYQLAAMQPLLKSMSDQLFDCAQFIVNYSETKNFWIRAGKNIIQETDAAIAQYNDALDGLMKSFSDKAVRDTYIAIHQIVESLEQLELDHMICTDAELDMSETCLDGTRTEIINGIVDWIGGHKRDTVKVFWLSGQAGRGKSAIASTIAAYIKDARGPVASFRFTRNLGGHTNLFRTMARDLACQDIAFRRALAQIIRRDPLLKRTKNIEEQWQKLILDPISQVSDRVVGNIVIIIDALDECHDEGRKKILHILASIPVDHLMNLRILLSSRSLVDIWDALGNTGHVKIESLDTISVDSAKSDVLCYITRKLQNLRPPLREEELEQLATKSDGLFEWARMACEFIRPRKAGIIAKAQVKKLISSSCGPGVTLLDDIYKKLLGELVDQSVGQANTYFTSVMCQIIWTAEPLPIESLNVMRQHFQTVDLADVIEILTFLGPLLSGTTDWITPVSPLHSSFYEFLQDSGRSGPFYVAEDKVHLNLAISSLQVMQHGLRFNICGLQSSYLKNTEVEDLEQRVKLCIPPHLSYSCRFFAHHIQKATLTPALGVEIQFFLRSQYVLFWLEALSLLKALDIASTALDIITNCVQGMEGYEDVYAIAKDCIKLVQTFEYAISTSTPHLYLSALPFLLAESVLSKHLFCNFSNLPLLLGGEGDLWPEEQHKGFWPLAVSPDGRQIVSSSEDNSICLWNVQNGTPTASHFQGHTACVYSLAFSPDGRKIVSGSADKTACCWNVQSGAQIGNPFRGHQASIYTVSFSPDGRKFASGSGDKTIILWSVQGSTQIGSPFTGHKAGVNSVAFSPNGEQIVSGSEDKTVCLWNLDGSQIWGPFKGHVGTVHSVVFSPDGMLVVSGSEDNTIHIWDAKDGAQKGNPLKGHAAAVYSVAFSPDGRSVVSGSQDKTICLWNAKSGSPIYSPLKGHTAGISSVAFSPDGRQIISRLQGGAIHIWDINTRSKIGRPFECNGGLYSIALSPDGGWIASGSQDHTIRLWDSYTGLHVGSPFRGHTSAVHSVSFSPDGTKIASGSWDQTICLWDTKTCSQIGNPFHGHSDRIYSVTFSPDGRWIASGSEDKTICIWSTLSGSQICSPFQGHSGGVYSVVFSPNGMKIASGSADNTIHIWNVCDDTERMCPFKGHTGGVYSVAFSPNGELIASGSEDNTICLWNAVDGSQKNTPLVGHTAAVYSIAFSPDGKQILSGSKDNTIYIWDAHTGSHIIHLSGHSGGIRSVLFSLDGKKVVSASGDATRIRVWDITCKDDTTPGQWSICFSSSAASALVNTNGLTIRIDSEEVHNQKDLIAVSLDGWIIGPEGQLLIWVPKSVYDRLYYPWNSLVIPKSHLELDLSQMLHGDTWQLCYVEKV